MIKIGIIEDHPMVANGVKSMVHLIWRDGQVHLFSMFPNLEQDLFQLSQCDIVIADIHLKDNHILDDLILIQIQQPNQKIVLFTHSHPWELGLKESNFPFWGYVQKNADLQTLTQCLTQIEQNKKFIQHDLIWEKSIVETAETIILTKREKEILHLIKAGKTSKEIAELLFLSDLTVKSHRQNMMRKFDVKNVVELLDKAQNHL